MKLPAFKVTQTSCSGSTVHRHIPRGQFKASTSQYTDAIDCEVQESESQHEHEESVDIESNEHVMSESNLNFPSRMDCLGQNVSLHAVKQQASACAWSQIRSVLRTAVIESSGMPKNQLCISCPEKALYRCIQCGPNSYYCYDCFGGAHKLVNIFHVGELWQVH